MSRRLAPEVYVEGIRNGDRVLLSRAITVCESNRPQDKELSKEILHLCASLAGKSIRIGITGSPGVGKSTFVNQFGGEIIERGGKIAVLAIDPSSTKTGGSILGDKTRMDQLAHHTQAYVRPSPSSGTLGGVAAKTKETIILCEAAGFDWIVVETVGVGQSEVSVRHMVDLFILLLLPNAGDDLQGIKKGIMEMADLLIVNKADGEALAASRRTRSLYQQALRLFPIEKGKPRPEVLTVSALEGMGIAEIWEATTDFQEKTKATGFWDNNRLEQELRWYEETVKSLLHSFILEQPGIQAHYHSLRTKVSAGIIPPIDAARDLFNFIKKKL